MKKTIISPAMLQSWIDDHRISERTRNLLREIYKYAGTTEIIPEDILESLQALPTSELHDRLLHYVKSHNQKNSSDN